MKSFLLSRLKSFGYAFAGLASLIRSERNMWIHLGATIAVIIFGLIKELTRYDWCLVVIAIGLVWIAEAFNTAIEKLSNVVNKEIHPVIKQVKDISAAAVLVAAFISVALAFFVFLK